MFVKSKLALAVSVLCFVQFPAVARDADAAKAELARTEDAIKAELAKPVGTPLASPSPAPWAVGRALADHGVGAWSAGLLAIPRFSRRRQYVARGGAGLRH